MNCRARRNIALADAAGKVAPQRTRPVPSTRTAILGGFVQHVHESRWAEVAITAGMLIGVVCIGNLVTVP